MKKEAAKYQLDMEAIQERYPDCNGTDHHFYQVRHVPDSDCLVSTCTCGFSINTSFVLNDPHHRGKAFEEHCKKVGGQILEDLRPGSPFNGYIGTFSVLLPS